MPYRHIEGVEVYLHTHTFLTSTLDGGEWSTSSPGCFTPRKNSSTHWIGGWVGLRASLDILEKWKIYCPHQDPNLGLSIPQPSCYTE